MASTAPARTPLHLWLVGGVSLLYGSFGAYDYVMTHVRDLHYLASSMPGVDPNTALAWIDMFPLYAKVGWALGVWGGLLGSLLLLMRSRYAVLTFAISMIGIVLSIGYQLAVAPRLQGTKSVGYGIMPWLIIVVGLALLAYSRAMAKRGVLH